MNVVSVFLDIDQDSSLAGQELGSIVRIQEGIAFNRIPKGTRRGKSAVGITAKLPDGKFLFLEVSMHNFEMVAAAFQGAEQRQKEIEGN